jgi:nitrogenase molybdenum-iron protein alpha/beta subunit
MIGTYLGVNAVSDAALIIDGPDCLFFKAEYIHGTHDVHATLLDPAGHHRVVHTLADTVNVVLDREVEIRDLITRVGSRIGTGAVLVSALPMASITGSQYDRLAREVAVELAKPVLDVPARSLQTDWLDGYAEVLVALARGLPLVEGPTRPDAIALVGPLVHRSEGDAMADVRELVRLCEDDLGLSVASVWPSGRPVAHLAQAGRAGVVVSLPCGRKAARILARRTGATLVEAPTPFGTGQTAAFLRAVAVATGREARAEEVIAAGIPRARAAAAWAGIPRGVRLAFVGDPGTAEGFPGLADDLGAAATACVSSGHPAVAVGGLPGLEALQSRDGVDLCIAGTRGVEACIDRRIPFLEHGFPSYGTRVLTAAPSLGWAGGPAMAERIANRLRWWADSGLVGRMPGH